MNTRLVLWGELGAENKVLLAIYLEEAVAKIHIYAIPKEFVTKEIQDTLFTEWRNGVDYTFPKETIYWAVDANSDSILPEEVRVDRPEIILQSQHIWSKKLMASRIHQLLEDEIKWLQEKVAAAPEYDQLLWDKTKAQWDKIASYQKKNEITPEQTFLLKEKIDALFDILKVLKKTNNKKEDANHEVLVVEFHKRLEDLQSKLTYIDQWKSNFEELKKIQAGIKAAPFRWNKKRILFEEANRVFEDLRKYKSRELVSKIKGRLSQLLKIADGLKDSIARDNENLNMQVEKMQHYTKGKLTADAIRASFSHIIDRIKEKEEKELGVRQTIEQLKRDMSDDTKHSKEKK